jgi:hypothetical protein
MVERGYYGDLLDDMPHPEAAQVRVCVRTLLRRPILHINGRGAELLPLVFRHRDRLRRLFANYLGYRLTVEGRLARLYKSADAGAGRGLPNFTPRAYAYLALTLAALVDTGRQILLSQLIADIRGAAAEAGIALRDDLVELRALTSALRHLVALGVLEETEGSVSAVQQRGAAEALITIDTDLLGLIVPRMRAGRASEFGESGTTPRQPAGIVARRRLVEDPVVLYVDLPDAEARYLRDHQRQEAYWLERYVGLQVETRAEGMVAIDPDEFLTDLAFPASSTVSRIALLILEPLMAASPPRADGCHQVTPAQVTRLCQELAARYPSAWAKRDVSNIDTLAGRVIDHLLDAGAARLVGDDLLLVPAAHRWQPHVEERAATAETPPDQHEPQATLFDGEEAEL